MNILIASGIYPPDIGGPAQYARNLYETWKAAGHDVKVAAYRWERAAPPGLRHFLYFTKILRKGWNADLIVVLDTWSAAVPTMLACAVMHKKYILRTGGDFLWEAYVERTGQEVLFKDFYPIAAVPATASSPARPARDLTYKERLIYRWGGAALRDAAAVIFSTEWQRDIFTEAYELDAKKTFLVGNYCGPRLEPVEPDNRSFVAATRVLKWKNLDRLKRAFASAAERAVAAGLPEIELDSGKAVYDSFVERMRHSYAVILASFGDISPNMIFDAIRAGVPFIVTREIGTADIVRECAVFVDPLDEKDIADKILWMADPGNRAAQAAKVRRFAHIHTWEEVGREIMDVWKRVRKQKGTEK